MSESLKSESANPLMQRIMQAKQEVPTPPAEESSQGTLIVEVPSGIEKAVEKAAEEVPTLPLKLGPVYQGIFLHQVILKSGRLKPEADGLFYPEDNQEAIGKLDYFCTVGRATKVAG